MAKLQPMLDRVSSRLPALAGSVAPFALILVLALEHGGYDLVPRSQMGILAWWAILLGVAAGLLPVIRVTRSGWIMLGIMLALAAWTALAALVWTQSQEGSIIEVSRVVTLLGFLLVLILLQGKEGIRRSLAAVGAAAVVIAAVALLSRFHPSWFDLPVLPDNYPKARLNHPVGYWNGLASVMAMGIAALLWSATWSRDLVSRVLSTAAIPILALVIYMTASRGGAIEAGAAIVVLLALAPGRLRLLARMALPAVFSVLLIVMVNRRPELRDNLGGVADAQGTEMILLTILVVIVGAGAAWLLETRLLSRVKLPSMNRKLTGRIGLALAAAAVVFVAGGLLTGFIDEKWAEFKRPIDTSSATVNRLETVSSGERYEQWQSAIEAGKTEVLTGIGPGAYEYWWSRAGDGPGFVKNAHSLYLEGFAELGIPGLLLTLALVLTPIAVAGRAASRNAADDRRPAFAAAAAGMTAFAVAAGIDWAWELTVLPATFIVLVAAVCGPSAATGRGRMNRPDFRLPFLLSTRIGVVAASLLALVVVAVPMIGEQRILDSQKLYREGNISGSIEKARSARNLMPWSATASIQFAQLQEEAGDGAAALEAARDAADQDPYNWKAWILLSAFAEREGEDALADEALSKAFELNRNLGDQTAGE